MKVLLCENGRRLPIPRPAVAWHAFATNGSRLPPRRVMGDGLLLGLVPRIAIGGATWGEGRADYAGPGGASFAAHQLAGQRPALVRPDSRVPCLAGLRAHNL